MLRGIKIIALVSALSCLAGPSYSQGITPCTPSATLAVTAASSNVQLSACSGVVLLWNVGATEAFYKYGTASTTAATTGTDSWSIPATSFVVLNLGTNRPYLAAITAAGTTTLRITQGQVR